MMFANALFSPKQETGFLIPMRNMVLLPGIALPIVVGRSRSVASAEAVVATSTKQVVLAAIRPDVNQRLKEQEQAEIEHLEDVYAIATLAVVRRVTHLPMGPMQLVVEAIERVQLKQLRLTESGYEVKFQRLPSLTVEAAVASGSSAATLEALTKAIQSLWQDLASLNANFPEEVLTVLLNDEDPVTLAYQTCMLLQQGVEKAQAVLEQDNLEQLLHHVITDLQGEVEIQRLRGEILGATQKDLDQQQREFLLRQQLKKIQEELGEAEPAMQEIEELRSRMTAANLPETVAKQAKRELARLERVGSDSAEGGVIRTYLDWLLEMPWSKTIQDNLDLHQARSVLDADHYGLKKIKDRIIEHLATFKLRKQLTTPLDPSTIAQETGSSSLNQHYRQRPSVGTVLCFVGPPGVGKTSLGQSIARALGRPFERISLGGLRDEAELRGHRRTYIGAMPGRIIQAIHRSGVQNPVILLDELDKVGMDYRGDPASVLLEILDPQQNFCFRDLYLDLDFDLSQVFFIGTANDLSHIPAPLLDRLEIIELSGYSDQEKLAIAQVYLLPRQVEKAGLPTDAIQLPPETLRQMIEFYTREAGVRRLEQQLGMVCRKVAVRYANGESQPVMIHPEQLEDLLGPKAFLRDELRKMPRVGVATGLAWTLAGGEVLFVEAVLLPQGQELRLTGQLGDVMEESAQIAYSYVWSHASALGINPAVLKENGVHIHVPSGAVPKDGPSAGVTMVSAIASLLTQKPVRTDTAMTGEINLSGEVLPIGGVREKIMAACRSGIKRVILPAQNKKDLIDVPEDICRNLEYIFCSSIEQVLENAILNLQGVELAKMSGNGYQQLSDCQR